LASDNVVIVTGPVTLIVVAASGMFVPTAVMTAVPGATAVIGITSVVAGLPSGKNVMVF
jgi:hypothetical protein